MVEKIAKINKKVIALLMSVLILISSVIVAYTVNAADTDIESTGANVGLMYQNTFTATGSLIKATADVDGTDIKKGFLMAQSYIGGVYYDRAYCLNMGKHSYSENMTKSDETLDAWKSLGTNNQEAIRNILALGLEGTLKGPADNYGTEKNPIYHKDFDNVSSFPIANGASKCHRTYSHTEYGDGTYSDSEIYIAVQLLIWEIQKGWRKPGSLGTSSKPLIKAYSNEHVKNVYDKIVDRAQTVNVVPSFAVKKTNLNDIKTFKFNVEYNITSKEYTWGNSIVKTDSNKVLQYYKDAKTVNGTTYPGFGATRSVKFYDSYNKKNMYLNVKASISGNKLTLTPESVTATAKYSTSRSSAAESGLPNGSDGTISANLTLYGPASGEPANAQSQLSLPGKHSCKIDPVYAYYDLGVSFENTNDRSFDIQKNMRIKNDNSNSTGFITDNGSIQNMEKGYYYYVKLPTGNTSYKVVEDGKVVDKTAGCENAASVLGLSTTDICYNKTLKEYYVIMGPTNADGVTATVDVYMRRYVQNKRDGETLTEDNIPYGNYYIFELGQADKRVWEKTDPPFDYTSYLVDMDPTHYIMPEGVNSYYFTYKEHLAAKDKDASAVREGIDTSTEAGKVEYYKRLKRIYRGAGSTESKSPTYFNNTVIKTRFKKECSDGQIGNILFKLEKQKEDGSWSAFDLTDCLADKGYADFYPYVYVKDGEIATYKISGGKNDSSGYMRETGYTPYVYLTAGEYRLKELGTITSTSFDPYTSPPSFYKTVVYRKYYKELDYKYFSIGSDDSLLDEFVDNMEKDESGTGTGALEFTIENIVNANIRLYKKDDKDNPLNGATFQLYNENMEQSGTVVTGTTEIDGETVDGVAVIDGLSFKTYYIQEIEPPEGYICDNTVYEVDLTQHSLDLENGNVTDYKSITIKDKPTETYITKADITGDEIEGAKLRVYADGNQSKTIDEWVSTKEPHLIKGLVVGKKYYLEETLAPKGYVKATTISFTINEDGTPTYVEMRDDTTKVGFNKVDEEGKPLAGAVLQLLDKNHNLVKSWTTDGTEYVLDGVLEAGEKYYLYEKSAPDVEYELAKEIGFTVGTDGTKQVITMQDNYKRGSVTIHKTDDAGKPLTGAEFELYKADGTKVTSTLVEDGSYTVEGEVGTYVVDSTGTFKIDKLRFGSYYLIETKAPEGKMPYAGKIEFTIKDDKTLNLEFTVKDDNIVIGNTGGSGYFVQMAVGIALLMVCVLSLIYLKRRKYNSK